MPNGLLIYNPEDFEKNKWFAGELLRQAEAHGLRLNLILRDQLILSINEKGQFSASGKLYFLDSDSADSITSFEQLDFVINRTRDSVIGSHFEKMGCKVFNSSAVTEICNHKGKTHQMVNSHGISSVPTLLYNKHYFSPELVPFNYPLILKSTSGHGGSEVFKVTNEAQLKSALNQLPTDDFILQALCPSPGTDIRVFTMGKEIVAAVRRFCPTSFKSNYSLGGKAEAYTLKAEDRMLVEKILALMDFDFVGIDFILDEHEQLLFNEIEDVVGTRTLYLNYPDIDIVHYFLYYIRKQLG